MKRMSLAALAVSTVALMVVSSALADKPEALPPAAKNGVPAQPYVIEAQLIGMTPDGQPTVLASPTMMTLEGRPATIQVGSMVPVPAQGNSITPLPAEGEGGEQRFVGLSFTAKIHSTDNGQSLLDADVERSWIVPDAPQDGFRLSSTEVRLIEPITLGTKLVVPLGQDAKEPSFRQFEITVTEAISPADKPIDTAQRPATLR